MEKSSHLRRPELPGTPRVHDNVYRRERKVYVDALRLIDDRAQVEAPPNRKPFLAKVLKGVGEVFRLRQRP